MTRATGPANVPGIIAVLLAGSKAGDVIELDAIGDAVGATAITQEQIDAILTALEAAGRRVASPSGEGAGEARLKRVLEAARLLRTELGRAPRPEEIAPRAGLSTDEVKHALALARV